MGQMGFFDLGNRYSGLDAKNEPLLKIDGVVPWEDLRARLEAVWRRADKARKSRAGRKPWDAIVMFKTIILCALYNLSDDQVEHQIRDRLSFMRFLGLGLAACRTRSARMGVDGSRCGEVMKDRAPFVRTRGRLAARTEGEYTLMPSRRARSTFACSRVPQGEHTLIPFRRYGVRPPAQAYCKVNILFMFQARVTRFHSPVT